MLARLKKIAKNLGPGFITGAADDDPSGIGTYSQTGALFGYNQLWTAFFTFPFMTAVQEMCGRIGLVTGRGLAKVIKDNYSKPVLYFSISLLFIANTVNVGADLGAMASSGQLLIGIPFHIWLIFITLISLFLQVFVPYRNYAKLLKYLTFSLFAYIVTVFVVKQDWTKIIYSTFVPTITFNKEYLLNIVAILGTTISPYLFFWQSNQEVEEEVESGKIRAVDVGVPKIYSSDVKAMRTDTMLGMFFSNLVMFFIIATTASTLGNMGIRDIQTADQAALALRPIAGDFAYLLFTLGILGTGLLAVPILAGSASYAISETLGWKAGLSVKYDQAKGFYLIIAISMLIGFLINFSGIKPFTLLYYTAIFNGICAPPLLILIMLMSNNKRIMGNRTNSKLSNVLGIVITATMGICAIALLVSLLTS
jgi:NRAMP (natural resistance-associated macrophage protein)-like metal ion transporter